MIKITVSHEEETPKEDIYPCLKIAEDGEAIRFTAPKTGMNINGFVHDFGHHSEDWDEDQFEIFHGKIILENDFSSQAVEL